VIACTPVARPRIRIVATQPRRISREPPEKGQGLVRKSSFPIAGIESGYRKNR